MVIFAWHTLWTTPDPDVRIYKILILMTLTKLHENVFSSCRGLATDSRKWKHLFYNKHTIELKLRFD